VRKVLRPARHTGNHHSKQSLALALGTTVRNQTNMKTLNYNNKISMYMRIYTKNTNQQKTHTHNVTITKHPDNR